MRALLVVPSGWAYPNLSAGLTPLGFSCERMLLSYSMGRECWNDGGESQARRNRDLLDRVRDPVLRPDLIVFVTYDDCLSVETLRTIRRLSVPTVCLHVDMVGQWYRILRTGPWFDFVWCAQKQNINQLRERGVAAHFLPMAAAVEGEGDVPTNGKACYFGAPQPFRVTMLRRAAAVTSSLAIHGYWFGQTRSDAPIPPPRRSRIEKAIFDVRYAPFLIQERLRTRYDFGKVGDPEDLRQFFCGSLAQTEIATTIAAAQLNLGFTYMYGEPFTRSERRQCRLREFEVPALCVNGPYLTQRFEELNDLFEEDREVLAWDSISEFESKIREVMSQPAVGRDIASRGRARIKRDHLWQHRFQVVLSELGIRPHKPTVSI